MKLSTVVASAVLAGFSFAANASAIDNVAVYATEKANGSMFVAGKSAFTKTFDVTIANLSSEEVDLSRLCLKAYTADNKVFKLDTVDETLTEGKLKEGKPVKGIAVFASEKEDVMKAGLIKLTADCK
ncbi:DUF4354 family protein [Yokenella regensburgei]|jgi:hypothetical protein|uniref:Uncharacterized protein DUF4354 n=1 Tax=Yokenella regensburgei TaxID=158877 RepID=A0ABX9S080_9ENTR|nr:DUF4354 family protein [Yokenella regensburgei]RKR63907.1 uncharacterized protein DUF4354 [Yokenella regensburgei]VFS24642.1 Uncharacterised protein [Yokenella regensburgei]